MIDDVLKNKTPEFNTNILTHCEQGIPFIIYDTYKHYVMIVPESKAFKFIGDGCEVWEFTNTIEEFIDRLKLALPYYSNFISSMDRIGNQKLLDA